MRLNLCSWIVFLCLALDVNGQAPAVNAITRPVSLEECIRMALEKNISIKIGDRIALGDVENLDVQSADLDLRSGGRLGVEQARLEVYRSYAYYDPVFNARAGQRYEAQTGGIDPLFGLQSGGDRWNEDFSAGLNGVLPTGTRYNLGTSLNRLSGTETGFDTNGFGFSENIPWQYRTRAGITVVQPLLRDFWIDGGRLNIKLAKNDLKMSEHAFQLLVMDIVHRVAIAYFDLLAARDQVKVQQKALQLSEQLVSENKKKVAVGTLAPLDERQAESQAATTRSELNTSTYEAEAAENILKALITDEYGAIQAVALEPTDRLLAVYQAFTLAESWRTGLESRPDYLLAKEEVERQNIFLKYYKNQLFPALDVEGTYGRNGLGESTSDSLESIDNNRFPTWGGAVVLRFPLTFRDERGRYKQTKIEKQRAVLSLKRVENEVLRGIDDSLKLVRSAHAATESTREARRFSEDALDAGQKKLEVGKSTSFEVLQLQRDLTEAAAAEILALSEYNKALHQVYFREGTTLQRMKVKLEMK